MAAEILRFAQLVLAPWAAIEWLRTLRCRRAMDPAGWSTATVAILCWVCGDLIRLAPLLVGHPVKPANAASQMLFALWGVLCAWVGWRLAARQSKTARSRFWLDSGMITSALLVVGWPTLLAPVLRTNIWSAHLAGGALTKASVLTHGFADLLMIASVLLLCSRLPSLRSGPMLYVALGQSAIAIADVVDLLSQVHGPSTGPLVAAELGWTLGIGFLGVNARWLRRQLLLVGPLPGPAQNRPVGRVGLTLPYLPLVAVLAFCGVRATRHTPWAPAETWLSILAVLVVMSRQLLVLYDNRRLLVAVSEREQRLRHHAFHDPLTGLANRLLFGEHLSTLTAQLDGYSELAVLFCDLDDFKRVNDHLGHAAGDRLLKVAAERLSDCAPPGSMVARLGGDEFAVVLTGNRVTPELVAADVMARFAEPMDLDGDPLHVVVSIGIARTEAGKPCTAEDLLSQADLAMLSAKGQGKGRYANFDPDMKPADLRDRRLVNDFAAALRAGELRTVYQPIVELPSGRVVGLEALARWDHPQRGAVPPDRFVALAEATGLIGALTDHMLHLVAADHVRWRQAGVDVPFVTVNISPTELLRHDFAMAVASAVEAGIPADSLILELTEGHAVPRGAALERLLHELHATGVRLALDDFGAGHHVLANLQRLPIDFLKIDRSIVVAAQDSPRDDALLGIYIDIGRALGVPVIAEGVETDAQAGRLTQLSCPLAQGYLFSRPLAPTAVAAQLKRLHAAPALPQPRSPEAAADSARQ